VEAGGAVDMVIPVLVHAAFAIVLLAIAAVLKTGWCRTFFLALAAVQAIHIAAIGWALHQKPSPKPQQVIVNNSIVMRVPACYDGPHW
jgi:hypothetical protein